MIARGGLSCLVLLLFGTPLFAQGVRGHVHSAEGEALAFATIYVAEQGSGATTNAEGYYEIRLDPGEYRVVFQYVGYEAIERKLQVGQTFIDLDVVLEPQVVVLKDVTVTAGNEDPAYTIMRRAIAKSRFHTQQVDRYTAEVYIKGTGQLKDAPFFMKKTLKKGGVEEGQVFITESVSEVEYIRPNTYNERVISIRSSGEDKNGSPNGYVYGSFYEAEIANSVSPLSPKAFSYYKFIYVGTHRDRGYEVSKILVEPRSRGDNVFEGYLEIVEDYWSIYSLNLKVTKLGVDFHIKQFYEPVAEKVWLPVTHEFEVAGKVLGFEFEGKYLATVSNYNVEVNPALDVDFEVVDEKVDRELATKLEQQVSNEKTRELQELLSSGKEVTRKQLKKVIRAYEKNELKSSDMPDVIGNRTFKVDSMAHNSDSAYWAKIRPVPLTSGEVRGYAKIDSLAEVHRMEAEGDTLKTGKRKGFHLQDLLLGNSYKVADRTHFRIRPLIGYFNTVDGLGLQYRLEFTKTLENKNWLKIAHNSRYAFSRETYNGLLQVRYDFGEARARNELTLEGGRYINQYNSTGPIHPLVNTFMTLFLERNYMKIYQQDYGRVNWQRVLGNNIKIESEVSLAERSELSNHSTYRLIDRSGEGFTPNRPHHITDSTAFSVYRAAELMLKAEFKPWQKFVMRNGQRYAVEHSSPLFSISYKGAFTGLLDSDTRYDLLDIGYRHTFKLGVRAIADVRLHAGKFISAEKLYFPDYQHFLGNRTPFVTTDPVGSFRLLPYYTYSTPDRYFTASLHYQLREFLVTRLTLVRLAGVRESFFVNYLATPHTDQYTEVGYGINYILRVFRVEAVASFQDGHYLDFGVRVGIAANLNKIL